MEKLTDLSILEWGKEHRGKALANVPASYLLWMREKAKNVPPQYLAYIKDNLDVLEHQAKRRKINKNKYDG